MAFSKSVWSQVKNLTKDDIRDALVRDGWIRDPASRDATITYLKQTPEGHKRLVLHYHPGEICGPKLIKAIIADAGWSEDDLRRIGLIK